MDDVFTFAKPSSKPSAQPLAKPLAKPIATPAAKAFADPSGEDLRYPTSDMRAAVGSSNAFVEGFVKYVAKGSEKGFTNE